MEIAFYILLVSWVILLACCIVAIARFKKANDSLDTSLDTVIELDEKIQSLWNQLNDAENDRDNWQNKYEKLEKNKATKATKEDNSIIYVDKGCVEYVIADVNVSANLIKDITNHDFGVNQIEDSLRYTIENRMMKNLLPYAKYYVTYDISSNSYIFRVMIPVVEQDRSRQEYYGDTEYPLTNILLEKVKEE
jgi:hypothetical protein